MASGCSIVILNWNGEGFLRRFLPSVTEYSGSCEVVVADNGSSDGSLEVVRKLFPAVRIVELGRNYGFAEGYNRALAQVESGLVVLLNSDVEVSPGWVEPLLRYMESHPRVAAVMPKVLAEHDRTLFEHAGASGGYLDLWGFPFCRGRIGSVQERDLGQYDLPKSIFWASGAAMVIRREAFMAVGGFDGSFFAHMEEIDLAWRLQSSGWQLAVEPASVVWHVGGGALPYDSPRKLFLNFRNSLFMLYKNLPGALLFPLIFSHMVMDGAIAVGYLFGGSLSKFRVVINSHIAFYRAISGLKKSRKECRQSLPETIYRGSILARYLFVSKRFGNLFSEK